LPRRSTFSLARRSLGEDGYLRFFTSYFLLVHTQLRDSARHWSHSLLAVAAHSSLLLIFFNAEIVLYDFRNVRLPRHHVRTLPGKFSLENAFRFS
jgi:hypothetical protein